MAATTVGRGAVAGERLTVIASRPRRRSAPRDVPRSRSGRARSRKGGGRRLRLDAARHRQSHFACARAAHLHRRKATGTVGSGLTDPASVVTDFTPIADDGHPSIGARSIAASCHGARPSGGQVRRRRGRRSRRPVRGPAARAGPRHRRARSIARLAGDDPTSMVTFVASAGSCGSDAVDVIAAAERRRCRSAHARPASARRWRMARCPPGSPALRRC